MGKERGGIAEFVSISSTNKKGMYEVSNTLEHPRKKPHRTMLPERQTNS